MIAFASLLQPLENILTDILEWLHTSAGLSWAVSIIVLTLMVRMVMVPLTVRQIHSMQRLQVLAPELKALQAKYKTDKKRQQEEVMRFYKENKVNPAASCLPLLLQIPIFISLFYVLRGFEKEIFPLYGEPASALSFLGIVPNITDPVNAHWSGWLLLVVYVLSQLVAALLTPVTDKTQRIIFIVLPFAFVPFIVNFPTGLLLYWVTTNLWTVGQGLVTRRMLPKPVVQPKRKLQDSAEGSARATARGGQGGRAVLGRVRPAARAPAQEARTADPAMTTEELPLGPNQVEGTGETVGEAKWAALRELERRNPGIEKSQVRFQVVSEGERGLLGVGFTPARVIAELSGKAPKAPKPPAEEKPGTPAAELRQLVELVCDALGVPATVSISESGTDLTARISGSDVALLIGKRGQTIDAIQHLANAVLRTEDGPHLTATVDAAGYRARRRQTLERAAEQAAQEALADGRSVPLEPMSAVERKLVHLYLQERGGVTTESEGAEPNRRIVVAPAE